MQRLDAATHRSRPPVNRHGAIAALFLFVLAGCQTLSGIGQRDARLELDYIGQQVLPHGHRYAETTVGGLSSIDYDATTGRYWAISDDRSDKEWSRFYELALDLSLFSKAPNPGHAGVTLLGVKPLKRLDGSTFPSHNTNPGQAADPEGIRVHAPSGRLVWCGEGERLLRAGEPPVLANPNVWEMLRDGTLLRPFVIPEKFHASTRDRGVRRNLGFEGLTFSPDYATLYVMTENALLQDGPPATLAEASPSRLLALDYTSGRPRAEYVIDVAPIPAAPAQPGGFADNGIVEILALDAERLLALERSFAAGTGVTIKLYAVDLRGATDVSGFEALAGQRYVPAAKRLLFDFRTLGIPLDNIEGMSWGPRLPGGGRSLVFLSDDNFNTRQFTQFLAFEVRER